MKKKSVILIVDDHPTNVQILKETLIDYNPIVASNGSDAIELALKHVPDLVLLDVMMPGMNGYEVCKKIREVPKLKYVKIIMISAKAMLSERLKGYEVGADDYVTKPFEEEELLAKVKVYLKLRFTEEIDNLKKDLLSLLCHETNTPLSNIMGPLDFLLEDDNSLSIEERRTWYEVMHKAGKSLHNLLQKVLTLCAIKSGQYTSVIKVNDLASTISDAVECSSLKAKSKSVEIKKNLPETAVCRFDGKQISSVIVSIIDNAINFSPDNSTVNITLNECEDSFSITISDKGPGIEDKYLDHVFDEFTFSDIKHHSQGQGLSLAIAQQIIINHNGTISVANNKECGTTFTVTLLMNPMSKVISEDL